MTTEIIIRNLTGNSLGTVNYSGNANAFLSNGYVSTANNVYFNAFRFAEGLLIKEDVGQGYARTFLNGLRIYSLKDKVLLADRSYHCCFYCKEKVLTEAQSMLLDLLKDAAIEHGMSLNINEAKSAIDKILSHAFKGNQLEIAQNETRRLLA